eukprot:COSAG06_NODE_36337_length_448_cov_0.994269_1_plen_36_part_01
MNVLGDEVTVTLFLQLARAADGVGESHQHDLSMTSA